MQKKANPEASSEDKVKYVDDETFDALLEENLAKRHSALADLSAIDVGEMEPPKDFQGEHDYD